MIVRITVSVSKTSGRSLSVAGMPVYIEDRQKGWRLTVVDRNNLRIIFDRILKTKNDLAWYVAKFEHPPNITIIAGYDEGKVYARIRDPEKKLLFVREGKDRVFLAYSLYVREGVKPEKKEVKPPEREKEVILLSKEEESSKMKYLIPLLFALAAGIVFVRRQK